jgi:hypothetical protein
MFGPSLLIVPFIFSLVLFPLLLWADNNMLNMAFSFLGCAGVGVFFGVQALVLIAGLISLPFEDEDIIFRLPRWIGFLSIGVLSIAIGSSIYYLLTLFPGVRWLHFSAMWLGCFVLVMGALAAISWLIE